VDRILQRHAEGGLGPMSRRKGSRAKIHHAVLIAVRKTSVSLESAFWQSLKEIAREHDMSRSDAQSIQSGDTEIYRRPFASSCSTSIGSKFQSASTPIARDVATTGFDSGAGKVMPIEAIVFFVSWLAFAILGAGLLLLGWGRLLVLGWGRLLGPVVLVALGLGLAIFGAGVLILAY
jgi:Ribbon-helix-helix domain